MTQMNKSKKPTHIENRLVVGGRRMDLESGISRCNLLYIEWINKILLYSTGNCIQYSLINHSEKECEKKCIYMCV